jgi:uncharacterized coiled-coil protein SlyX
MTYKIISTNGNQTEISTEINGIEYSTLVVCNEGELDSVVSEFISSITNPKTFQQVESVDLNTLVQEQQNTINKLQSQIEALIAKVGA